MGEPQGESLLECLDGEVFAGIHRCNALPIFRVRCIQLPHRDTGLDLLVPHLDGHIVDVGHMLLEFQVAADPAKGHHENQSNALHVRFHISVSRRKRMSVFGKSRV